MNKLIKLLPLTLVGVLLTTTACTPTTPTVTTRANWYTDTTKNIQNAGSEVLRYDISYQSQNTDVTFNEGSTFTTTLTTATLGTALTDHPYAKSYTENAMSGVYKYQAEQVINVTVKGQTYTDTITDTVYFRSHQQALAPIYSQRTVHTHSIFAATVTTLDEQYTTYYNQNLSKVTVKKSDKTNEYKLKAPYTLFDNATIFLAMRAGTYNGQEMACNVYIPADGSDGLTTLRVANATSTMKATDEAENNAQNYNVMKGYFANLGDELNYTIVSLYKRSTFSGQPQTILFATAGNATSNTYHTIPLRYSVSAPYGRSGNIVYNLAEIVSLFDK